MKLNLIVVSCIFIITACGTANNDKSGAVQLQLHLNKGDSFSYFIASVQSVQQDVAGKSMSAKNDIGFTYNFLVKEQTDSAITAGTQISRIKVKMSGDGGDIDYDSDVQPQAGSVSAQFDAVFGKLKGKPFTTVFDHNGRVRQVIGLQEHLQNLSPGGAGEENPINDNLFDALNVYPGKSVSPGDSWTILDTLKAQGFVMLLTKTLKFTKLENGVAYITVTTKYGNAPASEQDPVFTANVNGSEEGQMEIDVKTGLIKNAKSKATIDVKLSGGNQSVPLKLQQETTIEGKISR